MKCNICNKRKAKDGKRCHTCSSRIKFTKNPILRIFHNLKSNAKRRGKEFTISYGYFKELIINTDYLNNRGQFRGSYSIDRVNNELGYVFGNIQVLTLADNSSKGINHSVLPGIYTDTEVDF